MKRSGGKKREVQVRAQPRLGGGVLADSAARQDSGKINVQGIFTRFLAWGFPCHRRWVAIITVHGAPKKSLKIIASIKKMGRRQSFLLQALEAQSHQAGGAMTIPVNLDYTFPEAGAYQLVFSIVDTKARLTIDVHVEERTWPVFNQSEEAFAKKNLSQKISLRVTIACEQCSTPYTFEDTPFDELPKVTGVESFPESGEFECTNCGKTLYLRDLQGHLRQNLKDQIGSAMKS